MLFADRKGISFNSEVAYHDKRRQRLDGPGACAVSPDEAGDGLQACVDGEDSGIQDRIALALQKEFDPRLASSPRVY